MVPAATFYVQSFSIDDNIFNLMALVNLKLKVKRTKVYAFFIDLAAVFDRVNRDFLWYKLVNAGVSTKFIAALRSLYANTKSAIRTKDGEISEYFETSLGVKQGCLISPTLFSLFLDDLHDALGEGVSVGDREIRCLLFADDVVVVASTVVALQRMIDRLWDYCGAWGLDLNLNKSKIMVFRNGGKPSCKEKWTYGGQQLEVVNKFKYLGVMLTPTLSMNSHIEDRVAASKTAIMSLWKPYLSQKKIMWNDKIKVFDAAVRSILTYGAQVWGFVNSDKVESVLRFFVKSVFGLPMATPNYMLYIETKMSPIFLYTLKLHLEYILKLLKLPEQRLPNFLAKRCMEQNVFFVKEWNLISAKYGISLDRNGDIHELKVQIEESLKKISDCMWAEVERSASLSEHHLQYLELRGNTVEMVTIIQCKEFSDAKWFFKLRGDLLALRYRPFGDQIQTCPVCSSCETEDAYHFAGTCSAYVTLRQKILGKKVITRTEYLDMLRNCDIRIVRFCRIAWQLRVATMKEYGLFENIA